jgi:hypothetical protein
MFNLTEYASSLGSNDPLMFLVQFVILPFAILGGLVVLHGWHSERKKRAWVNAK